MTVASLVPALLYYLSLFGPGSGSAATAGGSGDSSRGNPIQLILDAGAYGLRRPTLT